MSPIIALMDANILVKDVVSYVFFDLAKASVIDFRWTPQIELEYVRHRARLRALTNKRDLEAGDWAWAAKRIDVIKRYLVPNFLPPQWDECGERLLLLKDDQSLASLRDLPDADDVHVALAAADWARSARQEVVLVTDNLMDFPAERLAPFGVTPLHPGDVLELAYWASKDKVLKCLKKTAEDFKDPAFTLQDMLRSVVSAQQFDNPGLAPELAKGWGVELPRPAKGRVRTARATST